MQSLWLFRESVKKSEKTATNLLKDINNLGTDVCWISFDFARTQLRENCFGAAWNDQIPKYHWQYIVFQQSHVYYCNDKVKLCLWKAHESGALKGTKRIKYHISDQPYLYQNQINVSTDMRNHTVRLSRGPLLLPAAHSIRAARHFAESSPLHWQLPGWTPQEAQRFHCVFWSPFTIPT